MKRITILKIGLCFVVMSCKQANKESRSMPVPDMMLSNTTKVHRIGNDNLKVAIKTKGAELTSIKADSTEYLWQGNPKFWNRQSPILFPIVGPLKDSEYSFEGKTYKMMQHGFARDYDFNVLEKTNNSITFEQTESEASKAIYPFNFVLQIQYKVHGKSLDVNYTVKNPSKQDDLYFTIGGHPAFNCPFENGQKRSDYQLIFDTKDMPKSQDKKDGFYIDKGTSVFTAPGTLKLTDTIFDNGSLTFNPNPFTEATFVHKPTNKPYLRVSFDGFPYLGIWSSKKNDVTPFVCIEPWFGVADFYDHSKDFKQKEGIIKLAPDKVFTSSYTIQIL